MKYISRLTPQRCIQGFYNYVVDEACGFEIPKDMKIPYMRGKINKDTFTIQYVDPGRSYPRILPFMFRCTFKEYDAGSIITCNRIPIPAVHLSVLSIDVAMLLPSLLLIGSEWFYILLGMTAFALLLYIGFWIAGQIDRKTDTDACDSFLRHYFLAYKDTGGKT